jgi:hypothetical protein
MTRVPFDYTMAFRISHLIVLCLFFIFPCSSNVGVVKEVGREVDFGAPNLLTRHLMLEEYASSDVSNNV